MAKTSMPTMTSERKAPKVWNASYCDMSGTVSIINDTIQFLSDEGQVLTIDLPSWRQHGECYGEVGLCTTQALVDQIRFQAEKALVVAGHMPIETAAATTTTPLRECAHCTHLFPRDQVIYRKSQFFCLRCEPQQRQGA